MESSTAVPFLLITSFLLGLVHGVDWDHIAAIGDITGTVSQRSRAFGLATLYVLGHALVVLILGISAIAIGIALPDWVDTMMERVVGVTLIFLGLWLIYSLVKGGKHFHFRSRWMLIIDTLSALGKWIGGRLHGKPEPFKFQATSSYDSRIAFTIGMMHGIGAETATQALLFLGVAGSGGKLLGGLMLLCFILGLVISNSAITLATLLGFHTAQRNRAVLRAFGAVVAAFSLVLGVLLLAGQGDLMPALVHWEPRF